jgi:hypothetical protein
VARGIASLKRHTALLKPHIQSSFLPDLYLYDLDNIVRSELRQAGVEESAIDQMIEGMEVTEKEWGMSFKMGSPDGRGSISIEDWIREYKKLDPQRDYDKDGQLHSPEQIMAQIRGGAQKEGYVQNDDPDLMPLPASFLAEGVEGRGALNPTGLVAMTSAAGIPSDKLCGALEAVLAAWKQHLTERLPGDIIQRVRNAFAD